MENKHLLTEIAQSAVIVANNKLLILSLGKYPDKWVFPGGRMNEGEHWKEGLKREIKEEIGLDNINIINIITVNNRKIKDTNQFGIYYYCTCNNTQVILSDEHNDYKWISNIQELDNINFFHPFLQEVAIYTLANLEKLNNNKNIIVV